MAKATAGLGASPWVILSSCHFLFFKLYDRHKTQVKKNSSNLRPTLEGGIYFRYGKRGTKLPGV